MKVKCLICSYRLKDTDLVLYRKPNGVTSVCCPRCFDQLSVAHDNLVAALEWEAEQSMKKQKEKHKLEKLEKQKREEESLCQPITP